MEAYLYLAVKIAAAEYILYKVWLMLFRDRLFGLWDRISVRRTWDTKGPEPAATPTGRKSVSLVGQARGGYLEAPVVLAPIPLSPVEETAEEDDEPEEDFEVGPDVERPSNRELYGEGNEYPQVMDYSTGRTYEQLMEAATYFAAPVEDEEMMMRTAETLSVIRGSDLFELIERQVGNTGIVGRLMAECLDENGYRLPQRKPLMPEERIASFDIGKYI